MEILRKSADQQIILPQYTDFKTDLGWTENAEELDKETLYSIINPIENYETTRYIHSPYSSTTVNPNIYQTDIWYYFYFLSGNIYTQDYQAVDLTLTENYKMLKQSTESFFRLEFYKTANDEAPVQTNRRMVFARNLSLPLGEKIFYNGVIPGGTSPLYEYIYFPVFTGSNYKNTENMYLFWFIDDSPFSETNITGNTFYMTAKFYNAKYGTIIDFVNKNVPIGTTIDEEKDLYYKVYIDRTDFSYKVYVFNGTATPNEESNYTRIGKSGDPIIFYERRQ